MNTPPTPNPATLLDALPKRAAVLIMMLALGHPSGETELARLLQTTPKTVRRHLQGMRNAGLLVRTQRYAGYSFNPAVLQILLAMGDSLEDIPAESYPQAGLPQEQRFPTGPIRPVAQAGVNSGTGQKCPVAPDEPGDAAQTPLPGAPDRANSTDFSSGQPALRPVNPDRPDSQEGLGAVINGRSTGQNGSTTTTAFNNFDLDIQALTKILRAAAVVEGQNVRSTGQSCPVELSERGRENYAALRAYGVGPNYRVYAACELEHVTPEYIDQHAKRLLEEGRLSPRLLLTVLESGDPAPEQVADDLRDRTSEAARRRYLDWPGADIGDDFEEDE